MEDKIPLYVMTAVLIPLVCYNLFWFFKELNFYRDNGWDFSKSFGPDIYGSDIPDEDSKLSPQTKLLYGYPTMIVGGTIFIIVGAAQIF